MFMRNYNINLVLLFYLCFCTEQILSGLNNWHMYDGVSIHDITSGDVFFEIIEPRELEYTYRLRPARDFGPTFNSSFSLSEAPLIPVEPQYACGRILNRYDLAGNVALAERGECSFVEKALNAEHAGARAIIITDIKSSLESDRDFYIEMVDDNTEREVNIPAGFLIGQSGRVIRQTLRRLNLRHAVINLPVNVTYRTAAGLKEPPWVGF